MKKITLILLLLFIKLSAQNKAGYLSDTNQPWGLESNITAMNTVYGMDWTQYDYSTVDANLLFIQDRKFIYLEGGDGSTSMMVNFINNNTVLIESWVASGGVLLISAATNEIYTPYNVGFGITSTLDYVESGEPSDVNHPFYTGSTFTPILNSVYNGSSLAHNVLTGPGLVPIMRGNAGQGIILGEKVHGSGLVIFSGLTTPFFVSYWTPQPLMSNVLYRMISYGVSINTIPTITAIANQSACPSTSVSNVEIAIDDAETPAGDLTLSATSSNQTLLPGANIVFGGSGANRTVSLTPALGENGTSSVVVTVDDGQGGTAISTFIFTVEDNIAPVVLTKNITVQLNAAGSVTVNAADLDNGSTDNCGIASYMLSTGTTGTVCATAGEGGDLNISAPAGSVFTGVTFASYGTPDGSCGSFTEGWCHASNSASIVSSYLIGQNTATIPATNDVFGDPCGGTPKRLYVEATYGPSVASFVASKVFSCADIGTQNVTLMVTDNSGNFAFANAVITVEDKITPVALTKNIIVQLDATGNATIAPADLDNGSTDACGIDLLELDITSFTCVNVGPNTVTLKATDVNGNVATQTAIVTVEDKVVPVVVTKSITVQLDATGNATIAPADIDNGSTDACGIDLLELDITSFTCVNVGPNTVTLKATDVNGNVATQTAIVTVEDKFVPVVATKNITVQLDATGNATITPTDVDNGSTDACGIDLLELDITSFTCANVGPNTVTLKATDVNGNVATQTAIVTVEDKVVPVVVTKNIMVQLDAAGNATITPADVNNGSTDACGIATLALDKTSFSCANVGVNTVILTVTDNNGNVATQTAIVTVEDKVAPVVVTKNKTIQLNAAGTASIVVADVNNGSTDNCGISFVELDKMAFACANVGANTVTLKVTDYNGNIATQTAVITVEDKIAPVVITKNITVQLDASSNILIAAADVNNGSTDNCGISLLELDKALFSCADVGENVVTLKVTDNSGNVATRTAIVTIVNSQPNLIRKHFDDVIFFDNSSKAFVSYSWYKNGVLVSGQTAQYFKDNGILNGSYYAIAKKIDGTFVTTCPLTFSASIVDEYLKIAPNPVKSNASYQILTNVDSAKLQNARITVFNILGVLVNDKMVDGITTDMIAPSTEGIYVVRMTLVNGKYFTKNLLVKN